MPSSEKKKNHRFRWSRLPLPVRLGIGALLVALLVFGVFLMLFGWGLGRPLAITGNYYMLEVPRGATLTQVARQMERDEVLSHRWLMTLQARGRGVQGSIKAGRYRFEAGVTPREALARLLAGATVMTKITLREGVTFVELKRQLRGSPDITNTLLDKPDSEVLKAIGAAETSPEGLFFPDTYSIAAGSSDAVLLRKMYQEMQQRLEQSWAARREGLPLATPYEALILASIVEKETNAAQDRALIASVLLNRLRIGMRLQADPTVIYGLGTRFTGNLRKIDLTTDTPYNTYMRGGLPPTPIAAVSQAALDAVLQAPQTKYFYFVARGDGTSEFSEDLDSHNRAVNKYILKR